MKKILAWALTITLTATAAIGGTLAYLTDRDSEANVFTVGNVEIDLKEDFEHGAELIPGVEIEKKPTITNTGDNDAWVWLEFAIPSALDNAVQGTEQGSNENVIHWNPKGATTEGYVTQERVDAAIDAGFFDDLDTTNLTADYINTNKMHWNVFNSIEDGKNMYATEIEVDGEKVAYNVYVLLYNKALTPGETTLPNIEKVFLDAQIDIDPNGDWYRVVAGNTTKLNWNSETNGNPVIFVSAYAMQKDGVADARSAYAAYQAQWGDEGSEYAKPLPADAIFVTTAEELESATAAGKPVLFANDIILTAPLTIEETVNIDLNGKSLASVGLELKNGGSIKNGTLKSAGNTEDFLMHFLVSGGVLTMDNVDVDVTDSMYAGTGFNSSSQACGLRVENAEVVLNNCNIKVHNDTANVYFVQAWAVDVLDATVTMNGGSITAECDKGTAEEQPGLDDPAFACAISADGISTMTLNDVAVNATYFGEVFDWQDYSSHFTFNTTDTNVTPDDFFMWWSAKVDVNHI